jgi:hypothetical protein
VLCALTTSVGWWRLLLTQLVAPCLGCAQIEEELGLDSTTLDPTAAAAAQSFLAAGTPGINMNLIAQRMG